MELSRKLTSLKKYLFTAYYDWLLDNELTPHLLVDATVKGVIVPQDYVKEGQIILSLLPSAIADYDCRHNGIYFKARFKGVSQELFVPFNAMEQLISLETGTAFPIGSALEQLDLAPEDEDLYPDEGTLSGPSFELDNDDSVNIGESDEPEEEDFHPSDCITIDESDEPDFEEHEEIAKKKSDLDESKDKEDKINKPEDKTPGFTFVDD